ncbi:MAG: PilC/PilY family type IV pilus protein, partial [Massilia sp.]
GLPAEARGWLDSVPGGGMRDGLGEARLAYLRGDRSREAGKGGGRSSGAGGGSGIFRRRTGILGDSMTSTPLLVGAPSASVQGPGYARFYERNKARANAVYVGANDGMLHAFDTETGAELFAYVPQALLPVIGELSSPTYRHRPYVDASAGYGEASLGGHWSSVLVSGMGMGARGVFALDVTNPAAFASGKGALWEFTERDDSAMGHVRSPPLIAKIKVGTKDKVPVYRHFAVVASGINNYGEDDAHADPAGALFLLALDKPPRERWKLGVNYYRLAAPAAEPGLSNALGPPALAVAADGSARFAYSGDLQGRLWRFDLDAARTSSGAVLFEARDSAALRQPITHAPKVVFAPGGGYLVLFATGKLIESADLQASSFAPQSMYAIHDSGATPIAPVRSRSQLAARTASAGASATITGAEFDYGGAVKGWYVDFPNARGDGERAAGSPALAAGTLFVNTVIPGADPCAGPASRTYVLDSLSGFSFTPDGYAISGRRTGDIVRGRTDPVPLIFDLFASVGQADPTGGARAVRTIGLLRWRADGAPPLLTQVKVGLPAKRISWREVANWRDLHAAARKTR